MIKHKSFSLADLAQRFQLELSGDPSLHICGVGTLANAMPGQLSFLANPRYRKELSATRASAVVLAPAEASAAPCAVLLSPNPYASFARIAALFDTTSEAPVGVHPSAVIDESAEIDPSASIGPGVYIGPRTRVEAQAVIGAGCVLGEDCVVGARSHLVARVTLVKRVRLGTDCLIHPGAVLGADGFGLAMDAGHWIKVPQLGGVILGDHCEIGANTTIDRGALEDTVLEDDVRIDNQVQIGHNVNIGAHTAIAGCAAVAGSAKIGRYCLIAGGAGVVGHIEICDRVTVSAMSLVTHSLTTPGSYSSGVPLQETRDWRRNAARFRHLDELARRVKSSQNNENIE